MFALADDEEDDEEEEEDEDEEAEAGSIFPAENSFGCARPVII